MRLISKYDLLAVPVVDDAGHMLGIVTFDDIIDAMIEESKEDVQKLGGMTAIDSPTWKSDSRNCSGNAVGGWHCFLWERC